MFAILRKKYLILVYEAYRFSLTMSHSSCAIRLVGSLVVPGFFLALWLITSLIVAKTGDGQRFQGDIPASDKAGREAGNDDINNNINVYS